jgi:hypothetical protein
LSARNGSGPEAAVKARIYELERIIGKQTIPIEISSEIMRPGILIVADRRPSGSDQYKIKTMKRQDFSLRDQEFFKLKFLALHETRCTLVG